MGNKKSPLSSFLVYIPKLEPLVQNKIPQINFETVKSREMKKNKLK